MNTAREVNRSTQRQVRPVEGRHKPLKSQVLGGYWRVPAFALVGAILAFSVSFIFKSQYSAVSRLIIHPNDSSYAGTDSGAEVEGSVNIGGIDITKQTTLGNTLVNLTTSNEAAAEIVKRIGVEKINGTKAAPGLGTTSKIINFLKVGGTGTAPTAEQAAIDHVRGALNVVVLDESWVMEITAWDPDPKMAGLIANTAADVAVQQGEDRFKENSLRELEYLNKQLADSQGVVQAKAQAVADFQAAHSTPAEATAGAGQLAALQDDLNEAQTANKAIQDRQAAVAAIVNKPRFDSSRLGAVVVSDAPGRPMRYLFLLVGALVGALAGLLLTWFRAIREDEEAEADEDRFSGPEDRFSGPDDRDHGVGARPDVRFDEVIDVRGTSEVDADDAEEAELPPLVHHRDRAAERASSSIEGRAPAPGRGVADDATLTATEAGSIAAALFDRPGKTRFSG